MTDEIKYQPYVADVLHNMRHCHVPPDKTVEEVSRIWADELEEAWNREKAAMVALKLKAEARFTVRCHHCHKKLENVNLNCFRWDGSDGEYQHGISWCGLNDEGQPFVEVRTSMPWTGDDLTDEERLETVTCPHCGKYPFGAETMNTFVATSLVMFPHKEDVEMVEEDRLTMHEVAEILADLFGDTCACNLNDISDWLPEHCDFSQTACPEPVGVACWEQYLKYRKFAKKEGASE